MLYSWRGFCLNVYSLDWNKFVRLSNCPTSQLFRVTTRWPSMNLLPYIYVITNATRLVILVFFERFSGRVVIGWTLIMSWMLVWTMMLLVATLSILSRLRLWSAQSDELIGGLIMNLQLVITIYNKFHFRMNKACAFYLQFFAIKYFQHYIFHAINSNKFDVAYFKTKGKLPSIWDYALPWTRSLDKCLNFSVVCCRGQSIAMTTNGAKK